MCARTRNASRVRSKRSDEFTASPASEAIVQPKANTRRGIMCVRHEVLFVVDVARARVGRALTAIKVAIAPSTLPYCCCTTAVTTAPIRELLWPEGGPIRRRFVPGERQSLCGLIEEGKESEKQRDEMRSWKQKRDHTTHCVVRAVGWVPRPV